MSKLSLPIKQVIKEIKEVQLVNDDELVNLCFFLVFELVF